MQNDLRSRKSQRNGRASENNGLASNFTEGLSNLNGLASKNSTNAINHNYQDIKAKWNDNYLNTRQERITIKSKNKKRKEANEIKMMELKNRIFKKLKQKSKNEYKLGLAYHFLNKNLMMMADKLTKNNIKQNNHFLNNNLLNTSFKIGKQLIEIEKEILEEILSKAQIFN